MSEIAGSYEKRMHAYVDQGSNLAHQPYIQDLVKTPRSDYHERQQLTRASGNRNLRSLLYLLFVWDGTRRSELLDLCLSVLFPEDLHCQPKTGSKAKEKRIPIRNICSLPDVQGSAGIDECTNGIVESG